MQRDLGCRLVLGVGSMSFQFHFWKDRPTTPAAANQLGDGINMVEQTMRLLISVIIPESSGCPRSSFFLFPFMPNDELLWFIDLADFGRDGAERPEDHHGS